jgi:hypothetical protein
LSDSHVEWPVIDEAIAASERKAARATGRVYDEENHQIGFVDVAETPHRETIAASGDVGRRLYDRR